MNYNSSQRAALEHNTGPCLVLAGPGSGKTAVITARLGFLLDTCLIKPEQILVITFTKASALEMQVRFYKFRGHTNECVQFGTFHAIYFQILSQTYHYTFQNIITPKEKRKFIEEAIKDNRKLSETMDETVSAEILLTEFSNYKNRGGALEQFEVTFMDKERFDNIYRLYEQKKKIAKKLDFDDMVGQCYELLRKRPDILKKWQQRFSYILIDEFQDINFLQYEVIKMLAKPQNNLFVVGDDDQSIYGFRGANPHIMQDFLIDYPGAKQVCLDVNYRCSHEIVKAAGSCIKENKNRMIKNMKAHCNPGKEKVLLLEFADKQAENTYIANKIKELKTKYSYEEMAVIYRTNREMEGLAQLLSKEKIPFQMKEPIKSIFEHFIARDFLEKMENGEAIKYRPYLMIQWIRKKQGYDQFLEEFAGSDYERKEDFQRIANQLQLSAKPFKTVQEWKEYIEKYLEDYKSEPKKNKEGVNLVTMHGSKGLEYSCVWIPNLNEGEMPRGKITSESVLEEERRMLYVAMTRAKERLELLYICGTKEAPKRPSLFLKSVGC